MGNFEFQLCNLDESKETEECFKPLLFADGTDKFPIPFDGDDNTDYDLQLQLPNDVTCKQCSLRWHYRTGKGY